ncbi:YkgJ family cysteine cluster protein [Xanthomonadaceae bacterium JHOS43]|nr:YkgJ family cysteine cluster protein [Xanthomonadaceae bacterium JHOS43]MCX7562393.1 YkgJ family cysteine cluster protein [Xanthomonadaceae bacterium XH05]
MHPCLRCGACCARFRVAFHWLESDTVIADGVPSELTEPLDPHRLCMRGTYSAPVRCVALDARIGEYSRCTIHSRRPSVCREVEASWEFGRASPQCDRSRIAHGLPVLTAADWHWRDAPANDDEQPDDTPSNPDRPTRPPLVA